jgi:hypothetical protein
VASNVPGERDSHYLLFDCDDVLTSGKMDYFYTRYPRAETIIYRTRHGFHVIVLEKHTFNETISELLNCPWTDQIYLWSGIKRKYWFLESPVPLVEMRHMRIERVVGGEKKDATQSARLVV